MFNRLLNDYCNQWISIGVAMQSAQIDQLQKNSSPPSQQMMDRMKPILEILQKSHPAQLIILKRDEIPFCGVLGTQEKACMLVNEKDLGHLTDEELLFVLSHEWSHIRQKDSAKTAITEAVFFFFQKCTLFAFSGCQIAYVMDSLDTKAAFSSSLLCLAAFLISKKTSQYVLHYLEKKHETRADAFAKKLTRLPQEKVREFFRKLKEKTANDKMSQIFSDHTRSLIDYRFKALTVPFMERQNKQRRLAPL
jgi:Zn-dependent protease with chaperone function